MKVIGAFAVLSAADAGTLAVTWEDCGAKHATVTDVQPMSISTGATETITGTGTVDEDVTSAHFVATVKASGVKLASCEGDGTADIQCKLPLGAGTITVKAVDYPLAAGSVSIPVEVKTSSLIPASLANVDTEIRATEQNGEDVICLNVHTAQQAEELKAAVTGALAVTWEDCGAKHATVTDVQPASISTGTTETITGTGTVDEDVTSAHFVATVKASGVKLASCEGDGTADIQCKLPLGAGSITVKAVDYPLAAGSVSIPVEVKTSALIPASLANVDTEIRATEQNGEDVICLNVHTAQQATFQTTDIDCSTAVCQNQCACSLELCANEISACLAESACAASQDCALACACNDNACMLGCAAKSPSLKALPVANCVNSKCASSSITV